MIPGLSALLAATLSMAALDPGAPKAELERAIHAALFHYNLEDDVVRVDYPAATSRKAQRRAAELFPTVVRLAAASIHQASEDAHNWLDSLDEVQRYVVHRQQIRDYVQRKKDAGREWADIVLGASFLQPGNHLRLPSADEAQPGDAYRELSEYELCSAAAVLLQVRRARRVHRIRIVAKLDDGVTTSAAKRPLVGIRPIHEGVDLDARGIGERTANLLELQVVALRNARGGARRARPKYLWAMLGQLDRLFLGESAGACRLPGEPEVIP
ncbi:MAG: hypothetical protein GY716_17850 [bacterium]|nr:hypothetical protein [bacterium]